MNTGIPLQQQILQAEQAHHLHQQQLLHQQQQQQQQQQHAAAVAAAEHHQQQQQHHHQLQPMLPPLGHHQQHQEQQHLLHHHQQQHHHQLTQPSKARNRTVRTMTLSLTMTLSNRVEPLLTVASIRLFVFSLGMDSLKRITQNCLCTRPSTVVRTSTES